MALPRVTIATWRNANQKMWLCAELSSQKKVSFECVTMLCLLNTGQLDVPLSSIGLEQAELLGKHLQQHKFTHVYSSDLSRAKQVGPVTVIVFWVCLGSVKLVPMDVWCLRCG